LRALIKSRRKGNLTLQHLPKAATGITGLDEVTLGGLPRGRPTLVCGGPGCGKTLLAIQFLVNGATRYDEPGVFVAFEETGEDLAQNVASLGFDLPQLAAQKKLALEYVRVERSEIQETGDYDLEGLFVRIAYAVSQVGAKRVVLDTIESLFAGLTNEAIIRAELRRLFRWFKDKGLTVVITGEQGSGPGLTRQGLEEYVSDCVIFLDHRTTAQLSTRRLRVVKYRGSVHGTNEYPFLIDADGISVIPITSLGLDHHVSTERISTGIAGVDEMLGSGGVFRGSSVLVSGTPGTGKTSVGAYFVAAACERGERAMIFAFEESRDQYLRNMRSIGVDLAPHLKSGLLQFHASRPTVHGLEAHLTTMFKHIKSFEPNLVVVDPVSALLSTIAANDVQMMWTRLIDFLKGQQITTVLTALMTPTGANGESLEVTDLGLSSLVDTWILLRYVELNAERNRTIYVLKSRGMPHSNQLREFIITHAGIELQDVYVGPDGVLTGSARAAQMSADQAVGTAEHDDVERKRRAFERRQAAVQAQIEALRADLASEAEALQGVADGHEREQRRRIDARRDGARRRQRKHETVELKEGLNDGLPRKRSGSAK